VDSNSIIIGTGRPIQYTGQGPCLCIMLWNWLNCYI